MMLEPNTPLEPGALMDFLHTIEALKCNTRHSWTSTGRHESVAEHSWRLAVMALLLREAMPGVDMDKVMRMCLIHDFGEAVTGDIPTFEKKEVDEAVENVAVAGLLLQLSGKAGEELSALFAEMNAMETAEARVYKALDKLEAVIQHNEAPLDTWLPLEYDLNRTYASEECAPFPFLKELREEALRETERKVKDVPAAAQK